MLFDFHKAMKIILIIHIFMFIPAIRGEDEICESVSGGFYVCKKSSIITRVNQTGNATELIVKISGNTSIAPRAFENVNIEYLELNFNNKEETLNAHPALSLESESFTGLSNLSILEINTANVLFTGNPFLPTTTLKKLYFVLTSMTEVPSDTLKALPNLEILSFWGNFITTLRNDAFASLKVLKNLYLATNRIETLEAGCFNGLGALEELHLNENRLKSLPSVFGELKKLKVLVLSNNMALHQIKPAVLATMPDLTQLLLDGCNLTPLQAGMFDSAPKLQVLNLGAVRDPVLPKYVFNNLKHLKTLELTMGDIETIEADAFAGLNLTTLDMSWADELKLRGTGAFNGLTVEHFSLAHCQIGTIPRNIFNNLGGIKNLDLSRSRVVAIESNALSGFNVTTLNLSNNRELNVSQPNMFSGLLAEKLLLVDNNIKVISNCVFNNLTALKLLDLSHNHIGTIESGAFSGLNLKTLDLSNNHELQITSEGAFRGLSVENLSLTRTNITRVAKNLFNNVENLKILDLSHNHIGEIEADALCGLNLTLLTFNNNRELAAVNDEMFRGLTVEKLQLRETNLRLISGNIFHTIGDLRHLDLSFNNIRKIETGAFSGLNFTSLDLSVNNLEILQPGMFSGLAVDELKIVSSFSEIKPLTFDGITIKLLILAGNQISKIDRDDFSGLTVECLDLSDNDIVEIVPGAFSNATVVNIALDHNAVRENPLKDRIDWGLSETAVSTDFWKLCYA